MSKYSTKVAISLDNLQDYEEKHKVNTPRSLEALRREGILPEELLFKPLSAFRKFSSSEHIQQLHYEYTETRRKELLEIAKNTYNRLVHRRSSQFRKSRSQRNFRHKDLFDDAISRAKDKHLHMINRMIQYEVTAAEKLEERQKEDELLTQRERAKWRKIKEDERRKAEEKRRWEIKRRKAEEEQERVERQKAIIQFKQEQKEQEQRKRQEEQRLQELQRRNLENEQKRKQHIAKIEHNLQKKQHEKEMILTAKQMAEEQRQKRIRQQREEAQRNLHKKSLKKEQKRVNALVKAEEVLEKKREEFEDKQQEEEQKLERFKMEQARYMEHLRQQSQERDKRIIKTKQRSDKIIEDKREIALIKNHLSNKRLDELRRQRQQKIEEKRYIEFLKNQKKEANIKRQRRKEEYENMLKMAKIQLSDLRTNEFLKERANMISTRSKINTQSQMQKYQIKEALYNMAVTKKWDRSEIEAISSSKGFTSAKSAKGASRTSFDDGFEIGGGIK